MSRPRLLDLFCGAGGAAMGYHRAGFDVVGVDIRPQPRYPFEFHQADALTFPLEGFDAIHASPPCQAYSSARNMVQATHGAREYPDLVAPTRAVLVASGIPYVIENVEGAPLVDPVKLCGSSFGRPIRRHRLFESSVGILVPPCAHKQLAIDKKRTFPAQGREGALSRYVGVYGSTRYLGELAVRKHAMGIGWMIGRELTQAIPPDYTELIGRQLMAALRVTA